MLREGGKHALAAGERANVALEQSINLSINQYNGKWGPASAGKAKAGMVLSVS